MSDTTTVRFRVYKKQWAIGEVEIDNEDLYPAPNHTNLNPVISLIGSGEYSVIEEGEDGWETDYDYGYEIVEEE